MVDIKQINNNNNSVFDDDLEEAAALVEESAHFREKDEVYQLINKLIAENMEQKELESVLNELKGIVSYSYSCRTSQVLVT
jgi:hypothetical protein